MVNVLFVCHGNICRSPMAEFLFKDYVKKRNVENLFHIESAATSREEIGNPVHNGTKRILHSLGIDCSGKRARQVKQEDMEEYDFIIGMDSYNISNLIRFFGTHNKIYSLLEFANMTKDISDPWYTGDFHKTYQDISKGLEAFYQYLVINHLI